MVWRDGKVVFSSSSKGVKPHVEALQSLGREGLRGAVMADKIVGRAAALLMMCSIPSEVHAGVITTTARGLLEGAGVAVHQATEVAAIKEKNGRIYCPFELMVQGIIDPMEAYGAIVAKLATFS
jgi:hypothetical protein